MSGLRVNNLKGTPTFPDGVVVTGEVSSTSFSGNLTGNVTGNVTGIVTGNVTGNIAGTTGSFNGNVSVGGTLSYGDVTNVDSVGVITARGGIKIGAGQSVSAVSGIITYYGDGSQLGGIESGFSNFVASGNIGNGDTVIIKADGTVGVVTTSTEAQTSGTKVTFNSQATNLTQYSATFDSTNNKVIIVWRENNNGKAIVGDVNPSNNSITFGSEVTFVSYTNYYNYQMTYNSNTGKIVIAFTDYGNGDKGSAIVGNVSGNSITFGSEVTFNNNGSTYDIGLASLSNDKVVIAFRDFNNSSRGTAVVGTISGTSISFGSAAVFNSTYSSNMGVGYDSTNDKVVIAFRNESNTSNRGAAVVGTVSGTSISFGSVVNIDSSNSQGYKHNVVHDTNSGKTVVIFHDSNISNKGVAYVGTVSGTSISFGSAVIWNNGATNDPSAVFDSNSNQILIAFQDDSDSDEPTTAIAGTVSGNTINFGSKLKLDTTDGVQTAIAFDSNSNRAVIAYKDSDNSNIGVAIVYKQPIVSTNVTTENYIGIAAEAIADGATGKINIAGGVNSGQTGLTTARIQYIQKNGSLGTSADDPSVVAGTSISSTQIIVKG